MPALCLLGCGQCWEMTRSTEREIPRTAFMFMYELALQALDSKPEAVQAKKCFVPSTCHGCKAMVLVWQLRLECCLSTLKLGCTDVVSSHFLRNPFQP